MKMVLQFQSVNFGENNGKYNGDATYLTDLPFPETSYAEAMNEIQNELKNEFGDKVKIKKKQMNIDGNSGQWGCTLHYTEAAAPLPLTIGFDPDTPQALYDYYIEHVYDNLPCGGDEIDSILSIEEGSQTLEVKVRYINGQTQTLKIPYPEQ